MTGGGVLAATPHPGQVSTSFSESMLRMVAWDATHDGALIRGGGPALLPAGINTLPVVRNSACAFLLDQPDAANADWLLFVDADMGFAEDSLDRLLAVADPTERPVVGALCFGIQQRESDAMGGYLTHPFPTIYDFRPDASGRKGFAIRWNYPPDTLTRVSATGAAFLLIHRDILAKLREEIGDTWFDRVRIPDEDRLLGEDLSFCARLGSLNIPVHVHTGVKTTHMKSLWVSEAYYRSARLQAMTAGWWETPEGMATLHKLTDPSAPPT